MKIESTAFTWADLENFMNDLVGHDRDLLVARLEAISRRLLELGSRVGDDNATGGPGWTAKEVLAHMAVLSKFYGTLTYRIGSGKLTEFDLLENVTQRDVAGEMMSRLPASQLVEMAVADPRRTAQYLRTASPADPRRPANVNGRLEISARDVAALPLCAHLELHLEQLEEQ